MTKEIKFRVVEEEEAKGLDSAYQAVFASPGGRKVLEDLVRYCGVLAENSAKEPFEIGKLEGRRKVGLYIVARARFSLADLLSLGEKIMSSDGTSVAQ